MQDVINTLTNQNQEILSELDEHVKAHEFVRKKLDRKSDVASLMNTFNKELVESKIALERGQSPLRHPRWIKFWLNTFWEKILIK